MKTQYCFNYIFTKCTAIWVAVFGDCDSRRISIICCNPSVLGSQVILNVYVFAANCFYNSEKEQKFLNLKYNFVLSKKFEKDRLH